MIINIHKDILKAGSYKADKSLYVPSENASNMDP